MSRALWLICVFVTAGMSGKCAAEGPIHGWERFFFEENEAFSDDQLLQALLEEPDFLLATHPHGTRVDLAQETQRLLIAGYKNSGFENPTVRVNISSDNSVQIHIEEGLRYSCGDVIVKNASTINVTALITRLSQPYANEKTFPTFIESNGKTSIRWINEHGKIAKPEKAVWQLGAPAKFGRELHLNRQVSAALKDAGYPDALAQVSVVANQSDATAQLVVDIIQEGAMDRVDEIRVVGSHVNSPNAVIEFLALQPGGPVDYLRLQQLTKRLWDSGRFSKHQLRLDRDGQGARRLNIELEDVPGAPPLGQPLSEVADTFLRARRWVSEVDQRNEDLAFKFKKNHDYTEIIQSQSGTWIQHRMSPRSDSPIHSTPASVTCLIAANGTVLSQSMSDEVWNGEIKQFDGSIRLETRFVVDPSVQRLCRLEFDVSWNSKRPEGEPLIQHSLNMSPANWIGFAYKQGIVTEMVGERLVATHSDQRIEIDVATGRLMRWDSDTTEMALEPGLFQERRKELERELAGKTNVYSPERPASTLAAYLLNEDSWRFADEIRARMNRSDTALDPNFRSALDKLVAGGLLMPVDLFVNQISGGSVDSKFDIPHESSPPKSLYSVAMSLIGKLGLKIVPVIFAENSWPVTVSREASLVMLGRSKYTLGVVKELQADESSGPLRDAAIAYLLGIDNHPDARWFAIRSHNNLTPEKFDADMDVLLQGPVGQWLSGLIDSAATLTPAEIESIGRVTKSDAVVKALETIRIHATTPAESGSVWYEATHARLDEMLSTKSR